MPEIQKYSLKNELQKADESLMGSPSLLGMTMLTYPNYINSMRSTMFTAHLKQFLNLVHPQFPFVFTNNENMVGKYSSGYKQTKSKLKVHRKIVKFEDIVDKPTVYKLFVFDVEKQMFDVIERRETEDLTENFGYEYLNDVIDSFNEGDIIDENTVLYHSTSYDDDMNYGYGRNVVVAYTLEPFTSEDAAIASMSMAQDFTSVESDVIKIGLNNNDYLINLYGDNHEYKPLPEIGEKVSNIIAVSRRQFNNQLLFDFRDSSLGKILDGDIVFYVDKDVEIIDYTIYNNSEERNDSPFYEQINKYIDAQEDYYQDIIETCEEIIESGYEYSREIDYLYKRALEMVDKEKKWKEGDSIFGNIEIEIHIKRRASLAKGCKITGRYGNKSVIAKIEADENMPYTKDGRRVDLLLNLLAIVNRTTSFPLYEIFMNGCAYQVRQHMKTLETFEEKEELLFSFLYEWNENQTALFLNDYNRLKKKEKEAYIQDAIDNGILMHQQPMWETKPIFYRCADVLEKFPFIKEDDLFIKKWGREYKVLTKYFIGEMYILKLLRLVIVILQENLVNCWDNSLGH